MQSQSPASAPPAAPPRLMSLDALRGFDMFWIAGGVTIYRAFTAGTENEWLKAFQVQLQHVEWEGSHFLDLIFPLFLMGLKQYTGAWYDGISWTGAFLVMWVLLWYMYRNKTFLRV